MSLLEYPSVHSSGLRLDELEDAFRSWADDPAKPDVVDLGQHGDVAMVELLRRLSGSQATLAPSACAKIGLPPGVTIATAATELLRATTDPDGPRCGSLRAASSYLRGLAHLHADLRPSPPTSAHAPKSREVTRMSVDQIDLQAFLPTFDVDRPIEVLLLSVARGDHEAFVALQNRMTSLVRVNVRRVLRNASRSEAVTQEIFAEVRKDAIHFDPYRTSGMAWLLTRAHQRAMDALGSADGTDDTPGARIDLSVAGTDSTTADKHERKRTTTATTTAVSPPPHDITPLLHR